jgi:hypothetical protein
MGSGIGKRAHDRALGALDRINALEQGLQNIIEGTQQSLVIVEERLQNIEELLTAAINVAGPDLIKDQVAATRKAKAEARIAAAQKALENALEKKELLPLDKLPGAAEMGATDADEKLANILLVGRELEADGTVSPPGRVQQPLARVMPQLRAALADGVVGTTIELPEGRKFVLDAMYIENPNPPQFDQGVDTFERELASGQADK